MKYEVVEKIKVEIAYNKDSLSFKEIVPKGGTPKVSEFFESLYPNKNGMEALHDTIDYFNLLKGVFEQTERGKINAFHYNEDGATGAEGIFQVTRPESLNQTGPRRDGTEAYLHDKIGKSVKLEEIDEDGTYEGILHSKVLNDEIKMKFPTLKETKIEFYTDAQDRKCMDIEAAYAVDSKASK